MNAPASPPSVWQDRWVRLGSASTLLAVLGCVATHVVTLLGLAGAAAWLGGLEHGLLAATLVGILFTAFAIRRHRRGACGACQPGKEA